MFNIPTQIEATAETDDVDSAVLNTDNFGNSLTETVLDSVFNTQSFEEPCNPLTELKSIEKLDAAVSLKTRKVNFPSKPTSDDIPSNPGISSRYAEHIDNAKSTQKIQSPSPDPSTSFMKKSISIPNIFAIGKKAKKFSEGQLDSEIDNRSNSALVSQKSDSSVCSQNSVQASIKTQSSVKSLTKSTSFSGTLINYTHSLIN